MTVEHREHYIGLYKDSKPHGYGKKTYFDKKSDEGLFENGVFTPNKKDIKQYNPNVHQISMKIDVDQYLVKDTRNGNLVLPDTDDDNSELEDVEEVK